METHNSETTPSVLKNIQSAPKELAVEALNDLLSSGKPADLPLIFDLLKTTRDAEISTKIIHLLGSLKDSGTIPYLIGAIQDEQYKSIKKDLVTACWSNGLDFTNYLDVFVQIMIEGEFMLAFEAYTVIVNVEQPIRHDTIEHELERLDQELKSVSDQKRPLFLDVIDFLPSLSN
jgi:hypothetical protein